MPLQHYILQSFFWRSLFAEVLFHVPSADELTTLFKLLGQAALMATAVLEFAYLVRRKKRRNRKKEESPDP